MTVEESDNLERNIEGVELAKTVVKLCRRIGLDGHRTVVALTMALAEVIVLAARPQDFDIAVEDCARTLKEEVERLGRIRDAARSKGTH